MNSIGIKTRGVGCSWDSGNRRGLSMLAIAAMAVGAIPLADRPIPRIAPEPPQPLPTPIIPEKARLADERRARRAEKRARNIELAKAGQRA